MTPQQQADDLLREWHERRRGIAPGRRGEKINHGAATIQCDAGFALFVCLASLREELRARAPTSLTNALPRYVTRARGGYSFQVYPGGPRTRLHGEPGTPEFRRAYNEALVDAIAAEDDNDE